MRALTLDARNSFSASRAAENEYNSQLRRVAKQVAHIVSLYQDNEKLRPGLDAALRAYAESLQPWAKAVADRMISKVSKGNAKAWKSQSAAISKGLRIDEMLPVAQSLQNEQVALITSLPIDAGTRAQELALQAATGGRRASDIAAEIANTGHVTASRATLIARTEVAKANSVITQARSAQVDSTHYIWRTADDADVRDSHAEMEGQIVAWDDPPTLSDGTTTHAGQFPNCRCYPEPVFN